MLNDPSFSPALRFAINWIQRRLDERWNRPFPSEDPFDLAIFFAGKVEDYSEKKLNESERVVLRDAIFKLFCIRVVY